METIPEITQGAAVRRALARLEAAAGKRFKRHLARQRKRVGKDGSVNVETALKPLFPESALGSANAALKRFLRLAREVAQQGAMTGRPGISGDKKSGAAKRSIWFTGRAPRARALAALLLSGALCCGAAAQESRYQVRDSDASVKALVLRWAKAEKVAVKWQTDYDADLARVRGRSNLAALNESLREVGNLVDAVLTALARIRPDGAGYEAVLAVCVHEHYLDVAVVGQLGCGIDSDKHLVAAAPKKPRPATAAAKPARAFGDKQNSFLSRFNLFNPPPRPGDVEHDR